MQSRPPPSAPRKFSKSLIRSDLWLTEPADFPSLKHDYNLYALLHRKSCHCCPGLDEIVSALACAPREVKASSPVIRDKGDTSFRHLSGYWQISPSYDCSVTSRSGANDCNLYRVIVMGAEHSGCSSLPVSRAATVGGRVDSDTQHLCDSGIPGYDRCRRLALWDGGCVWLGPNVRVSTLFFSSGMVPQSLIIPYKSKDRPSNSSSKMLLYSRTS